MRKQLLLLYFLLITVALIAQNHMEFRGVPITGHRDSFVSEMKKLGYSETYRNETGIVMEGKFTNKDAELLILSSAKSKTVWKVAAQIDQDESWSKLKRDYFYYVELYTSKYGQPSDHFEYFLSPYYEGDGFELQALRNEKCTYSTFFITDSGFIGVKITNSGKLSLEYEDRINSDQDSKEKESSVLDDI